MFEIFKIIWDLFMMRRAAKAGQLNWRRGLISFALVCLAYAFAIPASVYHDKHPDANAIFYTGLVLASLDMAFLIGLAFYWWKHPLATQP